MTESRFRNRREARPRSAIRTHAANDQSKQEYIKTILSLQEEDNKSVLLYVAFDLAVVSLTLSEKLLSATKTSSPFVAADLILLLISAALFFNYYRKMHLSRFKVADTLVDLDTERARKIPTEVWKASRTGYQAGYAIRILGITLLIAMYLFEPY